MAERLVEQTPAYSVYEDDLGRRRVVAAGAPGFAAPELPGPPGLPGPPDIGPPGGPLAPPELELPHAMAPTAVPPAPELPPEPSPRGTGDASPDAGATAPEKPDEQPALPRSAEESAGRIGESLEGERAAIAAGAEKLEGAQGKVAEAEAEAAKVADENLAEGKDQLADLNAEQAAERDRIAAEEAELDEMKEDPDRVWKNKSTGQKVAYYLSAALEGLSAARNKRPVGVPAVVKMIESEISRDLESQRAEIAKAERKVGRLWSSYDRGTAQGRWELEHAGRERDKRYQAVRTRIGDLRAQVGDQKDLNQLELLDKQIATKQAQNAEQIRQRQEDVEFRKEQLAEAKRARRAASARRGPRRPAINAQGVDQEIAVTSGGEVIGTYKWARRDPKTGKLINGKELEAARQYANTNAQVQNDIAFLETLNCGRTDLSCHDKWNSRAAALQTKLARMAGEKGPLSDSDIKRYSSALSTMDATSPSQLIRWGAHKDKLRSLKADLTDKFDIWQRDNIEPIARQPGQRPGGPAPEVTTAGGDRVEPLVEPSEALRLYRQSGDSATRREFIGRLQHKDLPPDKVPEALSAAGEIFGDVNKRLAEAKAETKAVDAELDKRLRDQGKAVPSKTEDKLRLLGSSLPQGVADRYNAAHDHEAELYGERAAVGLAISNLKSRQSQVGPKLDTAAERANFITDNPGGFY